MKEKLIKLSSNKNISIILMIILFLMPTLTFGFNQFNFYYKFNHFSDIVFARTCVLVAFGLLLGLMLLVRRKELKFDKIDKLLLVFYLLGWISTIFSKYTFTSIFGEIGRFDGMIVTTMYLIIYYCAKNFFTYFKNFITAMFIVITVISTFVIFESYKIIPIKFAYFTGLPYDSIRPSATLFHANIYGSFISLFLPIMMCLYIFTKEKKYILFIVVSFAATLCTLTRSAWLAFLVAGFVMFIYLCYKRDKELWKRGFILAFCLILTLLITVFTHSNLLLDRFNTMAQESKAIASSEIDNNLGSGRIHLWKMAVQGIIDHPIFGYGPCCYQKGTVDEQPDRVYAYAKDYRIVQSKSHNEYLEIAVTTGIPSLIVYLLAIFSIWEVNLRKMFKSKISLIFALSIGSYLLQAFFSISVIMVAPAFWFILGISNNEKYKEELEKKL